VAEGKPRNGRKTILAGIPGISPLKIVIFPLENRCIGVCPFFDD
jgi:hypothetical protein